ncbi:hypothetical protein BHE18_22255 [Rossellomorea aquimaris]|uniref:DUF2786 domain-containing protein n=2 Tax=Rossellomorea aquimaris TaxID=189382 RepID=A0A1J6W5X1_9BACI|nr:hypothetical protein BHE18_22255 [Rossellomorea aquimaris]
MTDQNKHIEKLKKLLALAASGNPHEAALALRKKKTNTTATFCSSDCDTSSSRLTHHVSIHRKYNYCRTR